ncbi:MAG: hypothetical protein QXE52_08260 [Candidatus Caldarchaeum sp.]
MATRILLRRATGVGTTETEIGDKLAPPTGLKWTLVEIRPRGSANATIRVYFDTELYHEVRTSITPGAYPRPHTVAVDVVAPHYLSVKGFADSGTAEIEAELVIEESPLA